MVRRLVIAVGRFLTRPVFGTRVTPSDARVDASRLPEDEFPLYCPKCDYLLRGLADGPCPECGTPFERSRLLVRQYVHEFETRHWRATPLGRAAHWCFVAGCVCMGLMMLTAGGSYLLSLQAARANPANPPDFLTLARAVFLAYLVPALLMLCSWAAWFALLAVHIVRLVRKRRAVIEAIVAADRAGP